MGGLGGRGGEDLLLADFGLGPGGQAGAGRQDEPQERIRVAGRAYGLRQRDALAGQQVTQPAGDRGDGQVADWAAEMQQ